MWLNTLNRQWKQPTPLWIQFSEHQLGQLLGYKESRAGFHRCDTRPLLTQIVDIPTRGDNILDLAFTSDPATISYCKTHPPLGNSDHKIVLLHLEGMVPRVTTEARKIYLHSKGDYEGLNNSFDLTEWEEPLSSKSIETNWDNYKRRYNELIEEHILRKFVKAGQQMKLPWTWYKSVKRAKKKHRAPKVAAHKNGLHADQLITDMAQRHQIGNHLCKGSLQKQDHRPVGREPQEVLELYPTLHKILELHWRTKVGREEIHQRLRQIRYSALFLLLSPDRWNPTRFDYPRYTNHKRNPHFET